MREVGGMIPLLLLLISTPHTEGTRYSLPGKPALTRCRSPEKETFTCWWEPGSDGGLPTTYALYYRKENSETVHECPDYRTAGKNSCFFNKNDTSIWVNYNITVVATNSLGSTFSDPVDVDVVYIVKPNPPEKVAVTVLEDKGWPFLRVSWEPPHKADTRSGWITLIYELRVKLEKEDEWEVHLAGQQKMFNIFSLRSGGTYLIQVRCKPDHGFWSEWSSTSYTEVPDYFQRERSVWILIMVFSAFIFLFLTWLMHINSQSLKHCILPPIPGPKIKGFDEQLLKDGKSDEIFRALVLSDFPTTAPSNYEDLLVEYLEVYVPDEQERMLEESKDLHDVCLKSDGSTSDSDSGRGSCDSHTLLMDKCAKEDGRQTDLAGNQTKSDAQRHKAAWEKEAVAYSHDVSPDVCSGRVKTWPSVFSPLPQYSLSPLETARQHCVSDTLFPSDSSPHGLSQPGLSGKDTPGSNHWKFSSNNKQTHLLAPQTGDRQQLQAYSEVNISTIGLKEASVGLQVPAARSTEYVEVQRVSEENVVLLHPVPSGHQHRKRFVQMFQEEDYSKVKGVGRDNVLLLERQVTEEQTYHTSSITNNTQKPTYSSLRAQEEEATAGSGYIDTASMFTLPSY
uniref:Prolactin receptor n=1 Tax=Salarias fasciatus TaxID=181472 RepID=A0A672I292_SALFA